LPLDSFGKQFSDLDTERMRKLGDVVHGYIPEPALDATDVRSMQICFLS